MIPAPTYEATDRNAKPTQGSAQRYRPEHQRKGTALCLSGGGFRATLFHLGALRRLNELGVLAKIDTITSVSGGSILAAFLAIGLRWPLAAPAPAELWDRNVAEPVRRFVQQNLRMPAILRRWLQPWNASAGARALMSLYARRLSSAKLSALPERPQFVFCATDMYFGVNFVFERARVGDYRLGYIDPPDGWDIARAVAASSCFPPVFNPLPLDLPIESFQIGSSDASEPPDVRLSDGGLYDNLGLEPVWKNHRLVLVSDGGAVFGNASDSGILERLGRYVDIIEHQASALRKRWLLSNFLDGTMTGTYWGIGSAPSSYRDGSGGYPSALVDASIAPIRTDLDAFSTAEIAVLENHGYALAEAAIATHLPGLRDPDAAPFAVPHPRWLDETLVRASLSRSADRLIFGRWGGPT